MARDIFHQEVREALEKDGWTITHDPLPLRNKSQRMDYEIDLGAERIIAAEKGADKIAVEVKSLTRASLVHEFHEIIGQYITYLYGLREIEPSRVLFVAIPDFARARLNDHLFLLNLIKQLQIKIIVFSPLAKTIAAWEK